MVRFVQIYDRASDVSEGRGDCGLCDNFDFI